MLEMVLGDFVFCVCFFELLFCNYIVVSGLIDYFCKWGYLREGQQLAMLCIRPQCLSMQVSVVVVGCTGKSSIEWWSRAF